MKPSQSNSQNNSPENQTRPNPTPQQKSRTRQTKTKQAPKNHTQPCAAPRDHGIKNMTHYRVLKQHTQPDLTEALRLQLVLASNSATVEDLPFQRQVEDLCPRSHLLAILCCGSSPRGSHRRLGPFGSGLYFRQSHPLDVKPDAHDPGHTNFSLIFQRFRRYARNAVATSLPLINFHRTIRNDPHAIIDQSVSCRLSGVGDPLSALTRSASRASLHPWRQAPEYGRGV